ncbi:neutral zinc metallopeptidase [Kribbella sp. NPDC056861]|uniref:neutral zinc metallopeptidase n=1 Tax=Kribbella sp. NPDC056861 TaxID=3154857 RepID=UPI003443CBA7
MVNLSSKKRVLAGVAAVAGFAALAMPVQAAQATGGVPPQIPAAELGKSAAQLGKPAAEAKIQGTQATTLASSNTNIVRYNKLYTTGAIQASKCKEVNVSLRTAAGVKAYDQQLLNCMWAAWAPTLKASGANYSIKPTLVIYSASKVATNCGTVSYPTSYFCGYGTQSHIYIPWAYIAGFWKQSPTYARAYATNTLAHEYGHHVQYRTGILSASWSRQYAFTTSAAKLEESRRRELQASCLGSAMLGANKKYYPLSGGLYTQWKYLVEHSGDIKGYPRDHGSFANHGFWSHSGFYAASSKTYANRCNTFNSASARVA